MTHYTIDYAKMTPQEAHAKAIRDIKEYLGKDKNGECRYEKLTKAFKAYCPNGMDIDQFYYWTSFADVQGYPVRAWYDEIWPYG